MVAPLACSMTALGASASSHPAGFGRAASSDVGDGDRAGHQPFVAGQDGSVR
jgi:hypothetical protein